MKSRQKSEELELKILAIALPMVRKRECAVDGGANVGLWSRALAQEFRGVLAFEPVDFTYRALKERMEKFHNVYPLRQALFDRVCRVKMDLPPKRQTSTAYYALPDDTSDIQAWSLDFMNMPDCDLLKLDLEGAELRALIGAEKTLERLMPLVIVECVDRQLKRYGDSTAALHEWMLAHQYRLFHEQKPNRIYIRC